LNLLDRFEQRIDQLVNGAFARAFRAEVQPVEIAAALEREIGDRVAVVSRERTVVPNVFVVELAPVDHERLGVYQSTLCGELADLVREYCTEQNYSLTGPVEVIFSLDEELDTGVFRVRSEARAGVVSVVEPMEQPPIQVGGTHTGGTHTSTAPPVQPRLVIAGKSYPLNIAVTRIGRGTDVDIRIDDPGVSRHHAEITMGADVTLRDLDSTNGTYLDGVAVRVTTLYDGAEVRLGTTVLEYRSG